MLTAGSRNSGLTNGAPTKTPHRDPVAIYTRVGSHRRDRPITSAKAAASSRMPCSHVTRASGARHSERWRHSKVTSSDASGCACVGPSSTQWV